MIGFNWISSVFGPRKVTVRISADGGRFVASTEGETLPFNVSARGNTLNEALGALLMEGGSVLYADAQMMIDGGLRANLDPFAFKIIADRSALVLEAMLKERSSGSFRQQPPAQRHVPEEVEI